MIYLSLIVAGVVIGMALSHRPRRVAELTEGAMREIHMRIQRRKDAGRSTWEAMGHESPLTMTQLRLRRLTRTS